MGLLCGAVGLGSMGLSGWDLPPMDLWDCGAALWGWDLPYGAVGPPYGAVGLGFAL